MSRIVLAAMGSLFDAINHNQSVSIRQISQNRTEQVGYYRFLENENVSVSELVKSLCDHCQQRWNSLSKRYKY